MGKGGAAGMKALVIGLVILSLCAVPATAFAKSASKAKTDSKIDLISSFAGTEGSRNLISIAVVMTILAFAPAILLLMSSFTRIIIVLSFLRQAIGIPQLPPNQVIIGLSLFLTFFVMGPTYEKINAVALSPYMSNQIGYEEFLSKSSQEMSAFLMKFTKEKDLALFMTMAKLERPKNESEIPMRILVPAFALSELKRAFQIGFLLYIPFLVIDMVVASVLLSAGMMMLPPIFISLPFKLMLFVLIDGWNLVVGSIIKGFY
jgi:flagellar biosynthesis protein FliP